MIAALLLEGVEHARAEVVADGVRAVEVGGPALAALQAVLRVEVVVLGEVQPAADRHAVARLPVERRADLVAVAIGHVVPPQPQDLADAVVVGVGALASALLLGKNTFMLPVVALKPSGGPQGLQPLAIMNESAVAPPVAVAGLTLA